MGFRPQKTVYTLTFDDPRMDGLEVKARATVIGEIIEVNRLLSFNPAAAVAAEEMTAEQANQHAHRLFEKWADILVEWNVEDDEGHPVPATIEGVATQEVGFIQALIQAWLNAVNGVSVPLGQTSLDGGPFQEASLPMEPVSESRAS